MAAASRSIPPAERARTPQTKYTWRRGRASRPIPPAEPPPFTFGPPPFVFGASFTPQCAFNFSATSGSQFTFADNCQLCSCGEPIDDDDETLIDLCAKCDRERNRERARSKRKPPSEQPSSRSPSSLFDRFEDLTVDSSGPQSDGGRDSGGGARASPAPAPAAEPTAPPELLPRDPAPPPAAPSEANRQAAEDWLERARAAEAAGDEAAARRHCERSLRLCESTAARDLVDAIERFGLDSAPAQAAKRALEAVDDCSVLEVSRGASEAQVKAAYKRLALRLHPDRNHAKSAEAAFKRLQAAYEARLKVAQGGAEAARTGGHRGAAAPATPPYRQSDSCDEASDEASDEDEDSPQCRHCHRRDPTVDFGDNLCDECYEELLCPECDAFVRRSVADAVCAECSRSKARPPGARSHSYRGGGRCSICHGPYNPPPTYCGNFPVCHDCRD